MSVFCTPFKPLCKKNKRALHLYSKTAPTPLPPPDPLLSPLSAVYIKGPSRSRCQPIKYIHFPGFYSAAHLLNIYEWRPLNSFQFTFKAGFIGATDVQQLIVQCWPTPLHLLPKRDFVNTTKLFRQSMSHVAS